MVFGRKFDFTELYESVKAHWLEQSSDEEDIWEDEEEESEEEAEDEEWVTGDDGIRYPKRFGTYERDVLGIIDDLNQILPSIPDKPTV